MAGGRVLFEGSYKELLKSDTPTGEEMRLTTSLKAKAREAKRNMADGAYPSSQSERTLPSNFQ